MDTDRVKVQMSGWAISSAWLYIRYMFCEAIALAWSMNYHTQIRAQLVGKLSRTLRKLYRSSLVWRECVSPSHYNV